MPTILAICCSAGVFLLLAFESFHFKLLPFMTSAESKSTVPYTITDSELLPLLEAGRGDLLDYAVGFVKIPQERADALLAGSGTLVSACGVHAILTAAHVINELPKSSPVGLILSNRIERPFHRLDVDMQLAEKKVIARGCEDARGPDLGLLILSPTDVGRIEATGKSFYNLSKRRDRMLTDPPPLNTDGRLVLSGLVDEWTRDVAPEGGFAWVKIFQGLLALAGLAGQRREGEFDYLSLRVDYDEAYKGPQSFKGCSGGGVWQAVLGKRDGRLEVHELLLVGVAFYESSIEGNRRSIECHGRTSIYEIAVKNLNPAACH